MFNLAENVCFGCFCFVISRSCERKRNQVLDVSDRPLALLMGSSKDCVLCVI